MFPPPPGSPTPPPHVLYGGGLRPPPTRDPPRAHGPRRAVRGPAPASPRRHLEPVRGQLLRPERVLFCEIEPTPAASPDVRARFAAGEPPDGLVPPAVARLVAERGLYRP